MNVTALVNTSGTAVERYLYDPYGNCTVYDDDWSDEVSWANSKQNHIRYCGYYFDNETGLYHVRNRVYDPPLGRFMQRDPIGYADGMGLYEYVGSGPIRNLDSLGLSLITSADPHMYENSQHERLAAEFVQAQKQFMAKLTVMSGQVRSMWDHCCHDDGEFADLVVDWEGKVSTLTFGGASTYSGTSSKGLPGWDEPGPYGQTCTMAGTLVGVGGAVKGLAGSSSSALNLAGNAFGAAGATLDACSAVQNFQAGDTDRAAGDVGMTIAGTGGLLGGPLLAIPVGVVGIARGGIHAHFDHEIARADLQICEDAKKQYKRYEEGYSRALRRMEEAYRSLLAQG